MRHLIIYHGEDNDGVFSGAIAKYYLTEVLHIDENNIDCQPHTYKTLNDLYDKDKSFTEIVETYQTVILTDLSFNDYTAMVKLRNLFSGRFMWIDHHEPVILDSYKNGYSNINGLRDTNHSALMNAWRFFFDKDDKDFSNGKCPLIFKYLSGWDSWSYRHWNLKLTEVQYVNEGMNYFYKIDIDKIYNIIPQIVKWYRMDDDTADEVTIEGAYDIGKCICNYRDIHYYNLIENYAEKDWELEGGRKACAIFVQEPTSSRIFKSLQGTDIKSGIAFKRQKQGGWAVSLYNVDADDTFHCGEYLKRVFNGGGHPGAAGCTIDDYTFFELLKTKKFLKK